MEWLIWLSRAVIVRKKGQSSLLCLESDGNDFLAIHHTFLRLGLDRKVSHQLDGPYLSPRS